MWVPPDPPATSLAFPLLLSITITGDIEDNGRFPGLMKLFGEGGTSKSFVILGEEKSSISLL